MRTFLLAACAACAASEAAPDNGPKAARPTPDTKLAKAIETQLGPGPGYTLRTYIQTDKPLYQPGQTIWFRADLRNTRGLTAASTQGATFQLISPRGSIVATKRVLAHNGIARNDFELAPEIEGGEYTIKLQTDNGAVDDKKIIINTYEAPRLMKTLELLRKAYGEGDAVSAAFELKRTSGEAMADHPATAVVTVDDAEIARVGVKTDRAGKTTINFKLPSKIARGDGLLTVLVEDGGVTESIQKRIPITLTRLDVGVFPEGGDLIENVPGRVYVSAKTLLGKPADISGRVVDDLGHVVSQFSTIHDGFGRVELQPAAGRRYRLEVTKPTTIVTKIDIPAAKPDGCVLRSLDDRDRDKDTLRVAAICKTPRKLAISATLRERYLAGGTFDAAAGQLAVVELPIARTEQGAVRVTLFTDSFQPLAERLIYHGRGADLKVTITPERKSYAPRDTVRLKVKATDAAGRPVKANIGVAVVDDTVLSYADDKSARLLAHLYLEPELGAAAVPIEEPNYYFSDKPDAVAAMDALLATRGYRRFEWRIQKAGK